MSGTCSLFPPFGDPRPSCLSPSQGEFPVLDSRFSLKEDETPPGGCSELRECFFLAFELVKQCLSLGLEPASVWTGTSMVGFPGSPAFRLRLELYHQLSWVSRLPTADLGTSQPPSLCELTPYNLSLTYILIHASFGFCQINRITGSVSLEKPDQHRQYPNHTKIRKKTKGITEVCLIYIKITLKYKSRKRRKKNRKASYVKYQEYSGQ